MRSLTSPAPSTPISTSDRTSCRALDFLAAAREAAAAGIAVYGGIVLDRAAGGINPVAGLRVFLEQLRADGIPADDLRRMTRENPARLLDW